MDLREILNLLASIVGAWGALHVLAGIVFLSPDDMRRLAQTGWDFSPEQVHALADQWADAVVGMALVVSAFALAFVVIALPPDWLEWTIPGPREIAVGGAVLLTLASYFPLRLARKSLRRGRVKAIGRSLIAFYVDWHSGAGQDFRDGHETIRGIAERFLGMTMRENESVARFVDRVLVDIGIEQPALTEESES